MYSEILSLLGTSIFPIFAVHWQRLARFLALHSFHLAETSKNIFFQELQKLSLCLKLAKKTIRLATR